MIHQEIEVPMSHPMRFLVLGSVLVILGACSDTASTAPVGDANPPRISESGKPIRSPILSGEPFEIPAGLACSFAVGVELLVNKEFAKTFPPEPNGDVVVLSNGRLVERLTNVSTGKSIIVNVSGPGRLTIHPDGSATLVAWGRSSNFFGPGEAFLFSGRLVIEIAPDGIGTPVSLSGHEEDICAALS
jgi:hypothetical protein